jgi:hypothetical protein
MAVDDALPRDVAAATRRTSIHLHDSHVTRREDGSLSVLEFALMRSRRWEKSPLSSLPGWTLAFRLAG